MHIEIITLFPDIFQVLHQGIVGRSLKQGILHLSCWNPRDFTEDKHGKVDDRPYGGGTGMIMKVQPLKATLTAAKQSNPNAKVIYLSPQGKTLTQKIIKDLATESALILINGRYEGIDERLIKTEVDAEYSIGDYIISGGEFASLVLIDAITRYLPGVLKPEAVNQDSFSHGRLDYPQYTRPEVVGALTIPLILRTGNHKNIAKWRLQQSIGRTWLRRPDLLIDYPLTSEEQILLKEFIREENYR